MLKNSFRNIENEIKVISYIVRKNHKISEKVEKSYFSIKAYGLFFSIIYRNQTTFPKDAFKIKIEERVKNPSALNHYISRIYKTNIRKYLIE